MTSERESLRATIARALHNADGCRCSDFAHRRHMARYFRLADAVLVALEGWTITKNVEYEQVGWFHAKEPGVLARTKHPAWSGWEPVYRRAPSSVETATPESEGSNDA